MNGNARRRGNRAPIVAPLLSVLLMVLLPSSAFAQWNSRWGGEIRMQAGIGGDQLASVQYSDGTQSELKMGTYNSVTVGPILELWSSGPSSIEAQAMVGWVGSSTGPESTDDRLRLNRFPLELLAFYGHRLPGRDVTLRLGGGISYHFGGGVNGTGSLEGTEIDMGNAVGGTAELTAIFGILSTGLRYTRMNVTVDQESMDASTIALFIGMTHPRN